MFFGIRMLERRLLMLAKLARDHEEGIASEEHMELITGAKVIVKSKI